MQKEAWQSPLTVFMLNQHQQPSPYTHVCLSVHMTMWISGKIRATKNYEKIEYCMQCKLDTQLQYQGPNTILKFGCDWRNNIEVM